MTTSQGMLLVMADIDPAIERDFNEWYEQEHLTERMAIPGFLRARRFGVGLAEYRDLRSRIDRGSQFRAVSACGRSREVGLDPAHGATAQEFYTQCVCNNLRPAALNGRARVSRH
jgi:hypothetical protein